MKRYPDFFLKALAAWQNGWRENAARRRRLISDLTDATSRATALPMTAVQCSDVCYRKRFLVPNNAQNGGDLWPLFWDGSIIEGVASWSTDYAYVTLSFKKDPRPGNVATLFATRPRQDEVVLNIKALWTDPDFSVAVQQYQTSGDPLAPALIRFGTKQSEVLLRSTLKVEEIKGFCGQVPSLEDLCKVAGISGEEEEDAIWDKMIAQGYRPTDNYWLVDDAATRVVNAVAARFYERLKERVSASHSV